MPVDVFIIRGVRAIVVSAWTGGPTRSGATLEPIARPILGSLGVDRKSVSRIAQQGGILFSQLGQETHGNSLLVVGSAGLDVGLVLIQPQTFPSSNRLNMPTGIPVVFPIFSRARIKGHAVQRHANRLLF